jgi:adenylyltransferase/sulfurtransferase
MTFREMKLRKNCEAHAPVTELIDYEGFCNPMHETDITAKDLAARIARGDDLVLVDVREEYEWEAGHIDAARHIPVQQIPKRLGDIPRDMEIVMICRSGSRSSHAQHYLINQGYSRVKNLVGGMKAWSRDVDPGVRVA